MTRPFHHVVMTHDAYAGVEQGLAMFIGNAGETQLQVGTTTDGGAIKYA